MDKPVNYAPGAGCDSFQPTERHAFENGVNTAYGSPSALLSRGAYVTADASCATASSSPPTQAGSTRTIEAAARHLSFTRAADELHVTQAALATVLLVTAGLLFRTVQGLERIALGFDNELWLVDSRGVLRQPPLPSRSGLLLHLCDSRPPDMPSTAT